MKNYPNLKVGDILTRKAVNPGEKCKLKEISEFTHNYHFEGFIVPSECMNKMFEL